MPKKLDLTDKKYGRLTAISPVHPRNRRTFWLWRCECGVEKEIDAAHVRYGRVVSCGCYLREVLTSADHAARCRENAKRPRSHGMSNFPEYYVWKAMRQRCSNPKQRDYRWYGALGVKVCDRWRNFEAFYSDMGPCKGLTLDRKDPFGNYEPSNCRWVDWEIQRQNKRK